MGQAARGQWSGGAWRWRHADACGLHHMSAKEVSNLLNGRQLLFVGNSVLRQEMYTILHLAFGKGSASMLDAVGDGHSATTLILDLDSRNFTTFHPHTSVERGLCRVPWHQRTYFTNNVNVSSDQGPMTLEASWHLTWPKGLNAESQHTALRTKLASTFPSSDSTWSILEGAPVLKTRLALTPTRSSYVQAFLFVRGGGGPHSVQDLLRRGLVGDAGGEAHAVKDRLQQELLTWARGVCTEPWRCSSGVCKRAPPTPNGTAPSRLPCSAPHELRLRPIQGRTGFHPDTLKCSPSPASARLEGYSLALEDALNRWVAPGHRWAVLSHIFAFMITEGAVGMHRCEHDSPASWGAGVDLAVLSSHAIDEFVLPLIQRRREGHCFAYAGGKTSTVVVRPTLPGRDQHPEGQEERTAASQAADAYGAPALTFVHDDGSAAEESLRQPASGIGLADGVHFNDTGRVFISQLMLNWMRHWLSYGPAVAALGDPRRGVGGQRLTVTRIVQDGERTNEGRPPGQHADRR